MHKEPVEWTIDSLSSRLYISPEKVRTELQAFRDQDFISESGESFHYNPDTPHHHRVEELAQLDQEKPVTLINLIYERPPDQLKKFAAAFKLKTRWWCCS